MMDWRLYEDRFTGKGRKSNKKRFIWTNDASWLLPNKEGFEDSASVQRLNSKIPTLAQVPQGPAKTHGVNVECYVITSYVQHL